MKCKYEQREQEHIFCARDGSIRKRGCPCPHHTLSAWDKFKIWFNKLFFKGENK